MIWIFGDSFASNTRETSWINLIGPAVSLASNGSSEYRIFKNYLTQLPNIKNTDTIIFVHTSPTRIFLKDDRDLSSRTLQSHPQCDIIVNDIFEKKEKQYIDILESIWSEDFFNDIFDLIVNRLKSVPNSYHITFFQSSRTDINNLNYIWTNHPGNINHLDDIGNRLVAEYILKMLEH